MRHQRRLQRRVVGRPPSIQSRVRQEHQIARRWLMPDRDLLRKRFAVDFL